MLLSLPIKVKGCYVIRTNIFTVLFFSLFILLPLSAKESFISGQLMYIDDEVLPLNAKVEVVLEDISVMDAPSEILGEQIIDSVGQIPIIFKIQYDDEKVQLGHRYAVRAKIMHNNTLLYITDTFNPVFVGNDNKQLNIMMKRVGKIAESRVMEGMYKYMADLALFKECVTGKYYTVAFDEDSVALEKAYFNEVNGSNIFLKVELKGKIVKQTKMEGTREEDTLIVERFIRILGSSDCTEQHTKVPITNNYWKLVELYGKKPVLEVGENEAHILLRQGLNGAGALKVVTGCSTIIGNYSIEENTIQLRASTFEKKNEKCSKKVIEKEFVAALDNARYWRIEGESLKLFDEMDNLLTIFEAVYF